LPTGGAVGQCWTSSPPRTWEGWPAEEDAGSEVSEWERREQDEERRAEAEELGAGEELPLFLPRPPSGSRRRGVYVGDGLCSFLFELELCRSLLCDFIGAHLYSLLGQTWAEG